APEAVPGRALSLKVAVVLGAVVGGWLLVRWLGRPALYCVLWTVVALLPTFNLSAQRWMYISSFGVCLLGGLIVVKVWQVAFSAGPVTRALAAALPAALLLIWGLGVMYQNVLWHRAGDEAQSILVQIKAYVPNP